MQQHDICCIGHITLDKVVTPENTVFMPGGTAFYFAHGLNHIKDADFSLLASLGKSEMKAVEDMRAKGIDVEAIESKHSVFFENIYGENKNERTQRVLAKADPFTVDTLTNVNARYIHLGTLLADDFPLEALEYLSQKGIISVDAQGYLRKVVGEDVVAVDWAHKLEALKYIDILKVNEHEAEVLTGHKEPQEAIKALADWGVKEVVLTLGSEGSIIYAEGKFHNIPAYEPHKVVDATGCGDTYMAGYLYKRSQGCNYDEAGRFAAAMCTIKLESYGPFSGSLADVGNVINNNK